jgi:hypothetical protein
VQHDATAKGQAPEVFDRGDREPAGRIARRAPFCRSGPGDVNPFDFADDR